MNFKLHINFTEEALEIISKAHQRIVLIKQTAGNKDTAVAWVSTKPWMRNSIEWTESFALYASNSEIMNGATIHKMSDKAAACGIQYKLAEGMLKTTGIMASNPENSYIIRNEQDDYPAVTAGLAQSVSVNGTAYVNNPINAVYLPLGQTATMTPIERVRISLQNDINDGTVITHLTSDALDICYEEGETEHIVGYNPKTGRFFLEK